MKYFLFMIVFCLCTPFVSGIDSQQLHRFAWANYLQYKKSFAEAQQWYQKIFEQPAPLYIHAGYIPFLFETQQFDRIVQLIPSLDTLFAENPSMQHLFVLALERSGKQKNAVDRLMTLSDKFKSHQEIMFQTMQFFIQQQDFKRAIEIIETYLNNAPHKPNNFIFYFVKAQLHIHLKQPELAYESIKKSLELYPQFDKSWLLYAMIAEQQGNISEAIKGYSSFLERTQSPNQQIEQHIIELFLKQKMIAEQKQKITINRSCFNKALATLQQKEYRKALQVIDGCLQEEPEQDTTQLIHIQYAFIDCSASLYRTALTMHSWLEQENIQQLWTQTVQALEKQKILLEYSS